MSRPPAARPLVPHTPPPGPAGAARHAGRIMRNEGPRGRSTRAAVAFRYAAYLGTILVCVAATHAAFAAVPGAASGGWWMLASAAFQLIVAVAGTWFFPNKRPEIVEQARHYVFGMTVFPGTGVALFMWATRAMSDANSTDIFVSSLNRALPYLYFLPVVLPAIIFVKTVAGLRTLNRVQLDDQELLATLTRNDGLQL